MFLGRKKAAFFNTITMGVYQLLTVALGFVVPKMLLSTYGPELHGYTSTTSTVMNYVALLNMGLSVTALQSLYQPLAEKNNRRISEVLNAIDKFYVRTGILYTLAVVGCAAVLPFVVSADISPWNMVMLMLVTGATSTLECFIYSKHRVLLQADQKYFIVNVVDTGALLIRGIIQIFMMHRVYSIILVQAVPMVMLLPRMLLLAGYVRKTYPNLDRNVPPDNSALSKRKSVFAHQIAGLVSNNTDVVLLSAFDTMTSVSVFSVYNLVFSHLYTLLTNMFSNGVVASFGQLFSEGKRDRILGAFETYELVYYMFISIVYSAAATLIIPFVRLYTGEVEGVTYVDTIMALLFVAIGLLNQLRIPCNTMINAAGHFKETSWRAILEAVINLVMSLCLFPFFGVYGLLIGTFLSFVYRTPDTVRYSNKYILERRISRSILRMFRVICLIFINCWAMSFLWKGDVLSWVDWCLMAVLSVFISGITTLTLNLVCEPKQVTGTFQYLLNMKTHCRKKTL